MTSINDLITGNPAHKWDDSDTCSGTVIKVEQKQQTDIETNEPRKWSNGDPMMQWVLTVQTDTVSDEDDGIRCLYARGGKFDPQEGKGEAMLPAILGAYRKAGISEMEGAKLTVKCTGRGKPSAKGKTPPRLFSAKVEPGRTAVPVDPDDPF